LCFFAAGAAAAAADGVDVDQELVGMGRMVRGVSLMSETLAAAEAFENEKRGRAGGGGDRDGDRDGVADEENT
jgi:hypothetical protein